MQIDTLELTEVEKWEKCQLSDKVVNKVC